MWPINPSLHRHHTGGNTRRNPSAWSGRTAYQWEIYAIIIERADNNYSASVLDCPAVSREVTPSKSVSVWSLTRLSFTFRPCVRIGGADSGTDVGCQGRESVRLKH
jgi:hypothetical protein